MRTAAEFCGEGAHTDDADNLAVLLAEQRHGAQLFGFLYRKLQFLDRQTDQDAGIDQSLNCLELFCCQRCEMREVEAHPLPVHVGARLLDVLAQHGAERRLQEVARRVVPHDGGAPHIADLGMNAVSHPDRSARQ